MLIPLGGILLCAGGSSNTPKEGLSDAAQAAFNELAIGCNDTGAVLYLMTRSPGEFTYWAGIPARLIPWDMPEIFDYVHIIDHTKSGSRLFLFCKEGFLVGKCLRKVDEPGSIPTIYREEVASGKQHPPRLPGFEGKVGWGATGTVLETFPGAVTAKPKQSSPSPLRCGIVRVNPATPSGYNVFVIIQNNSPQVFQDQLSSEQFILGNFNIVSLRERGNDTAIARSQIGTFGSTYASISENGKDDRLMLRTGSVRLRPGESMFVGFQLTEEALPEKLSARVELNAADSTSLRSYTLQSDILTADE